MATRFGPGAQQFPSPQSGNMRPGYMRLGSSNGPANSPNGYGHQQRPSGGGSGAPMRKPDRKDAKEVAWVHWRALKDFLTSFGDKGGFHGQERRLDGGFGGMGAGRLWASARCWARGARFDG
jgi:hypothetical protein